MRDGPVIVRPLTKRTKLGMNIYVGNLPYSTTPDDLREVFAAFGEVAAARIVNDRETGRAKGFGFVEMPNDEEAKKAIGEALFALCAAADRMEIDPEEALFDVCDAECVATIE